MRSNPSFSGPRCDQTHQNAAHSRSSNSCSPVSSKWFSAARTLSSSTSSRSSHSSSSCRRCGSASSAIARKCSAWRTADVVCLAARLEPLDGELADGFVHPEAIVGVADEALLDEGLERVQFGIDHLLRGLERAPAGEDGQAREQPLLGGVEQLVRPLDRRAERPLARIGIPAALQEVEALREPLEDLRGRERFRTGRGELDRERHVVECPAERADGVVGPLEAGAREEQRDGIGLVERLNRVLDLTAHAQALPARHEQPEVRARLDELRELRRRIDHLLEVVEDEEHLALADVIGEAVRRAEGLADLGADEGGIADRRELDPECARFVVGDELRGSLDR